MTENNLETEKPTLSRYPRWVWVFIGITLIVTTLPYFLGYANQGDSWQFAGFVFGVEDGNSYIAKMLRGANGEWLFRTPYTALDQRGVLAFLPYLLLGKLSAPPGQHEQLVVLFQFFRLIGATLSILASYDFLSSFIKDEYWQRWGVLLIVWGGGLGWLLFFFGRTTWLGSLSLEMYSPETFGFLEIFGLPHLAFGRALFLWGLLYFLFPDKAPTKIPPGLLAGMLLLVMGLMQPLTVVLSWAVIFSFLVLITFRQWRLESKRSVDSFWSNVRVWWMRSALIVLVSAPIVITTIVRFNSDPVLRQWTLQNQILSPHPLHFLLAYGLLIPFAIWGMRLLVNDQVTQNWLLIAWTLALPFFVYAPYSLQRRLAEGYWVALVILALVAFERSQTEIIRNLRFLLAFALPSSIILVVGASQQVANPNFPLFRPSSETEAFKFVAEVVDTDGVILASYDTGNALPAWAASYVIIGHGPESVGLAQLQPRLERFFIEETPDSERLDLITEFGVDYVFWGPHERLLGNWNPKQAQFLELQFNRSGFSIYKVNLQD